MMETKKKRVDVKGLKQYLDETGVGLSKAYIYQLARENRIPHRRIGTKVIFDLDAIEQWLEPERG